MKKIKYIVFYLAPFLIILLLGLNLVIKKDKKKDQFFNYKKINYQLKGKRYSLLVADSEEKRVKGLMNIRELKEYDGMIFVFENKDFHSFWNKNTYLDLKIFWLDNDRLIGEDFLPSIERSKEIVILTSPKKVNKVIEIPID